MTGTPKFGESWTHYRGGTYRIICTAEMEATGEYVVVYEGTDGNRWVRPYSEWISHVPGYGQRFVLMSA